MKRIFVLAVLTLVAPACASTVALSELQVGGVPSGASEKTVVTRLGEPQQRVETGEGTELHYPGLIVTVGWLEQQAAGGERRVVALLGTGQDACTPRGLCPGMAIEDATRLYGPAEVAHRAAGEFLEYYRESPGCWLQLSTAAGIIKSVAVACQP